jgi:LysW-gamma-L-alpha-aminoadipyl-6-phosphate/LysW-L-glutamyl-5-phosphate reductase
VIASVAGAAGYVGGELLRLIERHPKLELGQATSDRLAGRRVDTVHPNLRGRPDVRFVPHDALDPCDVLFLAGPRGSSMRSFARARHLAPLIVDLGPDFRLLDEAAFRRHYGEPGERPLEARERVLGIPELFRAELRDAWLVSVPGCMATAGILALHPLAAAGLLTGPVTVCGLTGSSGAGWRPTVADHHPERSGVMRVFAPTDHRHQAEIAEVCRAQVRMSAVAVEAVRGVQVLCGVPLAAEAEPRDLWALFLRAYGGERFVRLLGTGHGIHRWPEPKALVGTNFCDVAFSLSFDRRHLTVMAALDNLVKGAAGAAVQSLNVRQGWDEADGLEFEGLHPL